MNRKIIREYEDAPPPIPKSIFSQSEPANIDAASLNRNSSEGYSHQNRSGLLSQSKVEKHGPLATPQSRLIAFAIDAVIFGFGLGIVWVIWFITLAEKGTTPGHYLMGQVVVDSKSGEVFGWKKMVIREVLIKGILQWILGSILFMANYIVDASFIFTNKQRTLHDLMVGSQVIQCSDKTIIRKLKVDEIDGWLNK